MKVALDEILVEELLDFLGEMPYNQVASLITKINKNKLLVNLVLEGEVNEDSATSEGAREGQ